MYYVHDLLSYRTGTFGKLWFVAHNPSKMKNRRDFAAVVVSEKCKELLQHFPFSTACLPVTGSYPLNGVPLSIRTCSHIMFGIVFVFHKQCDFLYQDSQRLLANLKPMRLNVRDPKKTKDLPPSEFIMNVPPLPDNWEWDLISPTEQARFLENMNLEAQEQILIVNTDHRVENMNDITLREDDTDPRLKSSGIYCWPKEGQGLHPDDRPLTEQEIQQQWVLMNKSTDVIAEFLNPSTSGLIPDPNRVSDVPPEMQQSLDLLGLIELQDQHMVTGDGIAEGAARDSLKRLPGKRAPLSTLSDSGSESSGSGRFSETEVFAKFKSKPPVVDEMITGKENLERQNVVISDTCEVATSRPKESNLQEPLQDSNLQDTALSNNINIFNAGLSVTLSIETPVVRASQSAEVLEVKNRRKITPAVTVVEPVEAPPRGSKRDSIPGTRFSEASVRRFPDLSVLETQPVDGNRRKRRYRYLDVGPIEISNKAIKSCLQDCSDILRPFVPAALEEHMKADELLGAAGRGKYLGGTLSKLWEEALELQNEVPSEQPVPDASLAGMSIEAMREQASANASRNVTNPLSNSSRQIAEQTPNDPVDPMQLGDPKMLDFNNTTDMSKSIVENETLRTIPEVRETSGIIDPVIPVDISMPPPAPVNTTKTFDISLDLDSSLSMNNNDEKVMEAIGKGIQKIREENDNENINVDSVLFSQICAPGTCKKRLACRTFYSLLNLAKMEKICVKQPKMSEARRIRDPIYVQVL